MTAARRPESQEQFLEDAVAALTEADIPPDDQDGWLDPDSDPPAELAALSDQELEELLAAAASRPAPPAWPLSYRDPDGPGGIPWPAGSGPRDGTGGSAGVGSSMAAGFAEGGPLDTLKAGMALAGLADDAHARAGELDDDCLIGVLRAWRPGRRPGNWPRSRRWPAAVPRTAPRPPPRPVGSRPG